MITYPCPNFHRTLKINAFNAWAGMSNLYRRLPMHTILLGFYKEQAYPPVINTFANKSSYQRMDYCIATAQSHRGLLKTD